MHNIATFYTKKNDKTEEDQLLTYMQVLLVGETTPI